MIRDELVIDGQSVDLGKTNITLEYVNNMFTAVDKIKSSRSYTIKLPRTIKNERIFDYPASPSNHSSKVGKFLKASYRRNGISILRDARCYVVEVSDDSINVCLLWDALSGYSDWLSKGLELKDLGFINPIWSGTPTSGSILTSDVFIAKAPLGAITDTVVCLNLYSAVKKIFAGMGVYWDEEDTDIKAVAQTLCIPCTKTYGGWLYNFTSGYNFYKQWGGEVVNITINTWEKTTGQYNAFSDSQTSINLEGKNFSTVRISANNLRLTGKSGQGSVPIVRTFRIAVTNNDGSVTSYDQTFGTFSVEIDVSSAKSIQFVLMNINYGGMRGAHQAMLNGDLVIEFCSKDAQRGGTYHIETNAPQIKQVDIIKTYGTLFGMSLILDKQARLKFVKTDVLYEDHVDWTDKVVNYRGVPDVKFQVNEYARRNIITWTDDSKNGGYTPTAVLECNSETLKSDNTIFKLPFSASYNGVIEMYVMEGDELKVQDVKPRLMHATTERNPQTLFYETVLRFDGELSLDLIVDERYKVLRRILEYPVELKIFALLNEKDLADLDITKSVYLSQTGRYYAISKIKTDNDSDICEVTLIQI